MKLGRRGTTALEFGLVAPVLMTMLFGGFESARFFWTWQALQLAGDQTARCVAIGNAACASAAAYAVSVAGTFGASIDTAAVVIDTASPGATSCAPTTGNTATRVRLTASFNSPVTALIPFLSRSLTTSSCYPLTGK